MAGDTDLKTFAGPPILGPRPRGAREGINISGQLYIRIYIYVCMYHTHVCITLINITGNNEVKPKNLEYLLQLSVDAPKMEYLLQKKHF